MGMKYLHYTIFTLLTNSAVIIDKNKTKTAMLIVTDILS